MVENTSNFLYCGIMDKTKIINFYETLLQLTPTIYARQQIEAILEDETNHLQEFKLFHAQYSSNETIFTESGQIKFRTYRDGLLKAYESELSQYSNYRNALLSGYSKEIHDCFFKAMTDDLKHANQFMFLYFRDSL